MMSQKSQPVETGHERLSSASMGSLLHMDSSSLARKALCLVLIKSIRLSTPRKSANITWKEHGRKTPPFTQSQIHFELGMEKSTNAKVNAERYSELVLVANAAFFEVRRVALRSAAGAMPPGKPSLMGSEFSAEAIDTRSCASVPEACIAVLS
jgi:hypothetical protein